MASFETHRLEDMVCFAAHCNIQTHITEVFKTVWHGLLFLHGRSVYMGLKKRINTFFNFVKLAGFANKRHK